MLVFTRWLAGAAASRRPRFRSAWPLAGLLLLAVAPWSPGDALAAAPGADEGHEHLRKLAIEKGRVPVIVHLDLRVTPEATLKRAEVEAQRERLAQAQDRVLDSLIAKRLDPNHNLKLFRFAPAMALHADIAQLDALRAHPDVLHVSEDALSEPLLDDSIGLVGALDAWADQYTGVGYAVAVLDTGVGPHPFIPAGKIVSEACYSTSDGGTAQSLCPGGVASSTAPGSGVDCFTETGAGCTHGTHVAGIAAGVDGASSEGAIFGVAPGADVIAINVFSLIAPSGCGVDANGNPVTTSCVRTFSSDQILALERVKTLSADFNIAAVNMSLGGGNFTATCDEASPGVPNPMKVLIDELAWLRIATVVAAGNGARTGATGAPACISSAITVGSTTKADALSPFSDIAPWVDLLAPGSSICSSIVGSGSTCGAGYARFSGTSMAAPHVAGAWAVMRSRNHTASFTAIRDRVVSNGLAVSTDAGTFLRMRLGQAVDALSEDNVLLTDVAVPHLAWTNLGSPKFRHFYLDIPPGSATLYVRTTGAQGDADLYLRHNAKPTTGTYDCRSISGSSNESCTINAPPAGRWWIGILPYSDYRGLELLASYTRPANSLSVTSTGEPSVPITRVAGPSGTGGTTNYVYSGATGTIELSAPQIGPSDRTLFSRWEGCDSVYGNGSIVCVVNFSDNREINAVYSPISVNLVVQTQGIEGVEITGTPAVASGISSYVRSFQRFEPVSLTAPAQAYAATFSHWTGCDSTGGTGGRTCNVTMGQSRIVNAFYDNQDFSITVGSTGASAVWIDAGIYSGATNYSFNLASGKFHEFTAPGLANGLRFAGWSGCDPPVGGGTGPTGAKLNPPPRLCGLTVDGDRFPTAHYGSYPGAVGFSGDYADPNWSRYATDFGCGQATIVAGPGTVVMDLADGCAVSTASYTHRGAMVDGWISFGWDYTATPGHLWTARAGIVGQPMTTLGEGGAGGGGGALTGVRIRPGERLQFELQKSTGFGTTQLEINNFVFQPLPDIFYVPIFSGGFEGD